MYFIVAKNLIYLGISLCCLWITNVATFRVHAPEGSLMAIQGRPAVLGCEFTPDHDLSSLVVNWQREEDTRVVHSFYYQNDKLDRQSKEYHNRTTLHISELIKGNASLKINPVGLKDVGRYLCYVSNSKGTGSASIELNYGAFYSEPRLSIHGNSTTTTVQFETKGFPKPEVAWVDEHGQSLNHHLELQDQKEDRLYFIKSSYEVQTQVVNVTFTLKNQLLNQNLQRPVIYSYDKDGDGNIAVIILSVVSAFLGALVVCLMLMSKLRINSLL